VDTPVNASLLIQNFAIVSCESNGQNHRWEDGNMNQIYETGYESVDWIKLANDRVKCRYLSAS
jgi:hypothetical protein